MRCGSAVDNLFIYLFIQVLRSAAYDYVVKLMNLCKRVLWGVSSPEKKNTNP
jgi:hypothetical protein